MPDTMRRRSSALSTLLCAAILAVATPAIAAPDMNKVVREVFPAAETGFDPAAVHDLYSGTLIQGIFETLCTMLMAAFIVRLALVVAQGGGLIEFAIR